ncbi:MAG: cobalt ECF transporter T component CbiQ [Desulforhopalus sp.]
MHINIDTHILEYHERSGSEGLHNVDPRIKLLLLVSTIAVNIYFAKLWLSLVLFSIGTSLAIWSRIPARLFLLFFIIPGWSTLIVVCGFSVGFGTTPVFYLGPLTLYQEGFNLGLAAAARVACDMSWIAAVFLTTPFGSVLKALKWFRVPEIFLETIAMGFRYTTLLLEEFKKMKYSAQTRGGFQNYRYALHSTARILAQVVLRAYDRAIRIQETMIIRGAYFTPTARIEGVQDLSSDEHCPNECDVTPEYKDPSAPVVSCTALTLLYGSEAALHDISFEVGKGEIVVLCGPNGAGKTTLLKLLSGILTPSSGEVLLEGELLEKNMRKRIFQYVGLLCQDPNDQLFCTHVREDIGYGPENLHLSAETVRQLVDTAMELMEVSDLAERPIHRLSYGQMKRVGLAGLIAMKPPLLLLDEPSANLDPASTRRLVKHLLHLNSHHGYTFIVVTHDMNLAAQIADRIIVLDDGRIAADNTARKILTDEGLLQKSRLEPPLLTKMFQRLLNDPVDRGEIPLTIDEAIRFLKKHEPRQKGDHPGGV